MTTAISTSGLAFCRPRCDRPGRCLAQRCAERLLQFLGAGNRERAPGLPPSSERRAHNLGPLDARLPVRGGQRGPVRRARILPQRLSVPPLPKDHAKLVSNFSSKTSPRFSKGSQTVLYSPSNHQTVLICVQVRILVSFVTVSPTT